MGPKAIVLLIHAAAAPMAAPTGARNNWYSRASDSLDCKSVNICTPKSISTTTTPHMTKNPIPQESAEQFIADLEFDNLLPLMIPTGKAAMTARTGAIALILLNEMMNAISSNIP